MIFLLLAISLLSTWVLVRLAIKYFPSFGLLDRPYNYGLKRAPIPYYGGIVVVVAFLLNMVLWLPFGLILDFKLILFLSLALLVAIISFFDDYFGIKPIYRLFLQVIVGVGLYVGGISISVLPNPIGTEIGLDFWRIGGVAVFSLIATVFWVILVMNTLNWSDGIDGMTSGIGAISALVIFLLAMRPNFHTIDQNTVAVMASSLFIILAVVCRYEFYPAKILMGDTGTMFIGFLLAGLVMYSGGKLATAVLVLGFPILDAFWVVFRRLLQGKSPLKGDLQHFHHRLLNAGLPKRKAVLFIYVLSLFFGLLALVLDSNAKIWAIIGMTFVMAVIGFLVVILEVENARKKS